MELQRRYIAGQSDLEQLAAVLYADYSPAPGPDPHARYTPNEGPLIEPTPQPDLSLPLEERMVSLS